jgi:hypothetical protein
MATIIGVIGMDAILNVVANIVDAVHYHFQVIFSVMCGLIAAAWIDLK